MEVVDFRFRAMGSQVHAIVVEPPPGAPVTVRSVIACLERLWSRFDPDSDISRLNRASGDTITVAPETITLLDASLVAWQLTDGAFDPTVFGALVAAGDVEGRPGTTGSTTFAPGLDPSGAGGDLIAADPDDLTASLPPGIGFDPGGIGKGLAADLTVLRVLEDGAAGVMVNIGGDLRAEGVPPDGEVWSTAVEDPFDPSRTVAVIRFSAGGVATSSASARMLPGGGSHLIDPSTSRPIAWDRGACTVLSGAAWLSEAFAKAALVAGPERDLTLLDDHHVAGLVIDAGGIRLNQRIGAYL
jgi:thiamine biosynthesis lipoprotein